MDASTPDAPVLLDVVAGCGPASAIADRLLYCARQLEPLARVLGETADALKGIAEQLSHGGRSADDAARLDRIEVVLRRHDDILTRYGDAFARHEQDLRGLLATATADRDDLLDERRRQARDTADAVQRLYTDVRALGCGTHSPFLGQTQPIREHALLTMKLLHSLLTGDDAALEAVQSESFLTINSLRGVRESAHRIRELASRSGAEFVWQPSPGSKVWTGCDPAAKAAFAVAPAVTLGAIQIAPSVVFAEQARFTA